MINFCTLFDSRYISRGLALYESLRRHCENFHIYFFAFNDECYKILSKLALKGSTVISLCEFEDGQLLAAKTTRSSMEYCWTCTPSIIRYTLDTYNLASCTYLDADLYFFGRPELLLDELRDNSVMITEHRYTSCYDKSKKSGKYCVQFMTFKNNAAAKKALNWWRSACNDWCYARHENGKFGDQKYLDDWPERFEQIYVSEHPGGGLAPWNIQQYYIRNKGGKLLAVEKKNGNEFEVIFYHFHHVKFYNSAKIDLGGYQLSKSVKELLYKPYVKHLEQIKTQLSKIDSSINCHGETRLELCDWENLLRYMKRKWLSNIVNNSMFINT